MKLTWFAATTLRVHIGGSIFVTDPALAPAGIDQAELISGADRVVSVAEGVGLAAVGDPSRWRRRALRSVLDEEARVEPDALSLGAGMVLIDAPGEPLLSVIDATGKPAFGRWADAAVVVLCGGGASVSVAGEALLSVARPKLVALATPPGDVDTAIDALRDRLDGAGLSALEAGMAVEV